MILRTLAVLSLSVLLPGQAKPEAKQPFAVAGRVVAWDGQPIAGARLVLGTSDVVDVAEALKADGPVAGADGRFTLTVPPQPPQHADRLLVVVAKGFAARRVSLPDERPTGLAADKPIPLGDLLLPPGQRIVGRVRDAAGKPIAGARVVATDLLPRLLQADDGINYLCTATSNGNGIFDLPCALPAGSQLTVCADGYHAATRAPVAAGTPLEFELSPAGFVEGRVEAAGGGAGERWIHVAYEADQDGQQVRTDAQGAFRIPLRHPGRWRLRVFGDQDDARTATSPLGDGPATGVVLALDGKQPATGKRMLTVLAKTKGSGAAVRTFRAIATWGEMAGNDRRWLQSWLAGQLANVAPCADGSAEIDGPAEEGQGGAVLVLAEGHAPYLQGDVTWEEGKATLTVELEPEASVRGVVRDAATKQPLAGARLVATAAGGHGFGGPPSDAGDAALRSAADGSFRIGQLGEGEWLVQVMVEGRPAPPPTTVTLQAGEARGDLVLDVPVGARVAGKLVGAPLAPGMQVSLLPVPVGQAQQFLPFQIAFDEFGGTTAPDGGKPLGADGSFAFDGLALGHYTLLLHLPAPPRSGASLFLPIDSFRLREGGHQRDVDIAGDRLREIRGRITLTGATTPIENLIVVAQPDFGGQSFWHGGYEVASGIRAFVGRDGTFVMPVLAGAYRLQVVDLGLGAVVATSKPVTVHDGDATCDLAVHLVPLTVECKPANGQVMALVDRIEVRCVLPAQREAGMTVDFDDNYDFGRGIRLPRGATTLTLAVPVGDVTLIARNNAARLRHDDHGEPMPPLGKLELPVAADSKPAVLEIAPPPELTDPPADAGKTEPDAGKKER